MVALIVISFVLLVVGFVKGFETGDGKMTDVLLYWAYIMIGLAAASWIIIGLITSIKNDPKSIVKIGIILIGLVVVCGIAYLLAPGAEPMAYTGEAVAKGTLKLTDTILNLTYFAGAAAIIAIIVGEVKMSISNKK